MAQAGPQTTKSLHGPTASRPPEGERRARILAAAAKRFAATGFATTTVRQIADDVGVQSGSLYHHFETKEGMLHEIVEETVGRMRDNARRIAAADTDAERRLVALIVFDLREMIRNRTVHAILYQERKLFRRTAEFDYVLRAKKDAYEAWERIIGDGVAKRLFNPSVDAFFVIHGIVRMLQTAADWFEEDVGSVPGLPFHDIDRVIDFHVGFVLNAIRAKGRVWDAPPREEAEILASDDAGD